MELLNYLFVEVATLVAFLLALFFAYHRRKRRKQLPAPAKREELAPPAKEALKEKPVEAKGWRERLTEGLQRTHSQLLKGLDELLLNKDVKVTREQTLEALFEGLIQADVGVRTSELLIERVRERLNPDDANKPQIITSLLKEEILRLFDSVKMPEKGALESPTEKPHVILMVGVNGVGKTTTVGKLAFKASQRGQKVAIGAADTFRAAAVEQLKVWAERAGAAFVQLKEGADPASVAFEAVRIAHQDQLDLCLVDTAGRLHNRQDLMQELAKVKRVMGKEIASAPQEVLLVLDATTGQNALQQARIFSEIVEITGLVLTKLDGTAKGGVAIAVVNELNIPIRYIGVGETVEDLEVFQPAEFVDALFTEKK